MTTQINKICQSGYYHLSNVRKIRRYLTDNSTKLLVQAVIMARVDYCNSLLYGTPAVHLAKLQHLQNSAARLISHTPRHHHITPVLYTLHWLPVRFRIEYQTAVITFKTIHGMAPKYLHDLIDIRQNRHYNLRSSKGIVLCDASGKFKRTLGDRSFRAAAPKIWNKLPDDVKVSQKLDTFKRKLKTHYLKLAF